jgi:hypothetical protein
MQCGPFSPVDPRKAIGNLPGIAETGKNQPLYLVIGTTGFACGEYGASR